MLENVRADMRAYDRPWYRELGFWVTAVYRFGACAERMKRGPTRTILLAAHRALAAPPAFFRGVYLPSSAAIGPGLCVMHAQNIVVGAKCEIGHDCALYHDVTLGRQQGKLGVPKLGNHVQVFAGAKIVGNVTIGEGTEVGANAVVTRDVPPRSVVVASPCRVLPAETSRAIRGLSSDG
jgi:serine O-acetyltransferase